MPPGQKLVGQNGESSWTKSKARESSKDDPRRCSRGLERGQGEKKATEPELLCPHGLVQRFKKCLRSLFKGKKILRNLFPRALYRQGTGCTDLCSWIQNFMLAMTWSSRQQLTPLTTPCITLLSFAYSIRSLIAILIHQNVSLKQERFTYPNRRLSSWHLRSSAFFWDTRSPSALPQHMEWQRVQYSFTLIRVIF